MQKEYSHKSLVSKDQKEKEEKQIESGLAEIKEDEARSANNSSMAEEVEPEEESE